MTKRTALTTPTVSSRMARMTKAGMIKKFVPILSRDSVNRGVSAVISLKVASSSVEKLARNTSKLPEVENVYLTTGQGMTLKVALDDVASPRDLPQPESAREAWRNRGVEPDHHQRRQGGGRLPSRQPRSP